MDARRPTNQPPSEIPILNWLCLAFLAAIQIGILAYLVCLAPPGQRYFSMDDGYIYVNYVRNAAQGHWFQYNPGEYSGGITGFLWFLIQVPVQGVVDRIGGLDNIHTASRWTGALCGVISAWTVFALARRLTGNAWAAFLSAAVYAIDYKHVWGITSALEQPLAELYALLSVLCAWESVRGSDPTAGRKLVILSVFAFSCRPELVAWQIGLAIALGVAGPKEGRWSVPAQVILATFLGFAFQAAIYSHFTGAPLPSSFYVKAHEPRTLTAMFQRAILALQTLEPVQIGLLAASVTTAVHRGARRNLDWLLWGLPLLTFYAGRFGVATWVGQEHRYLNPPLAVFYACGLAPVLATAIDALGPSRRKPIAAVLIAAAVAFACWSIPNTRDRYLVWYQGREKGDVAVGRWLAQNTKPGDRIAVEPAGSIHAYSGRFTVDIVGLTTPGFIHPRQGFDWPWLWPLLRERHADYLVFYPSWFMRDGVAELPPFLEPVQSFYPFGFQLHPISIGSSPITIYRFDWSKYPMDASSERQ